MTPTRLTGIILSNLRKDYFQVVQYNLVGNICSFSFCNQVDIPMAVYHIPVLPKKLPGKTLNSVACCRFSHFACDRDPKTTVLKIIMANVSDKIFTLNTPSRLCQLQKIRSLKQPVGLGESVPFRWPSWCQSH